MFSLFLQTQHSKKSRSRSKHCEWSNQRKSHYSNHPSHDENHHSHHNLNYYQNHPRQPRNKNNYGLKDSKVDLPSFYGNENVEDYLNWEMKLEQIYYCHHIDQEKRVTLATLSFQGPTMTWWTALMRDLRVNHNPPIRYWNELQSALRRRYMSSYYDRELMQKSQRLQET